MSLKTGPQAFVFPERTQIVIRSEQKDFAVYTVNDDGEPDDFLSLSHNGKLRFRTTGEIKGYVKVSEGVHWAIEVKNIASPYEDSDPIPVEVPEDAKAPETLEDKLKRMLAGMVAERYGHDSDEMETFEDAMDFDIDDDLPSPLSGYEVQDMQEDFPVDDTVPDLTEPPPAEPSEGMDAEASTGSTEEPSP